MHSRGIRCPNTHGRINISCAFLHTQPPKSLSVTASVYSKTTKNTGGGVDEAVVDPQTYKTIYANFQ